MTTAAATADTFRIPFWRMYLPAAVYAQSLFAPLMWMMFFVVSRGVGSIGRVQVELYILGAAAVAGLLVPLLLIYVLVLRVRVSREGFSCSNGFGGIPTVPWESITGVKRLNVPGFP